MGNTTNTTDLNIFEPYKDMEFEVFIKQIGNASFLNWSVLAEALGVHRETIIRWKKHPLARKAIAEAIEENIRKMTEAGKNDWKMYREKLKMLGVKDKSTIEHDTEVDIEAVLDDLETDYEGPLPRRFVRQTLLVPEKQQASTRA